jgi:hypothetical protein
MLGGQRDASQPDRRPRAAWSSMSGEWRPDFARIRVGELVQVQAGPRSRTLTSVEFRPAAPGRPW